MKVIDLGMWTAHDGRRYLLEWHDDGELLLDGDVVTFIATEETVRRRLNGWEFHCDQRNSLTWLAHRLGGRF